MTQEDNPYVVPLSNTPYSIPETVHTSKVLLGTFFGAATGIGFQVAVHLMIAKPIPLSTPDARYLLFSQATDLYSMIFWAFVVSTCCAILGSIVGALLDTFYADDLDRSRDQRDD